MPDRAAPGLIPAQIPFGAVVATCRLVDVRRTEECWLDVSALDRRLGNFARGRFAWFLEEIIALPEPIPARGAQGFWEWTPPAGSIEPQSFRLEP